MWDIYVGLEVPQEFRLGIAYASLVSIAVGVGVEVVVSGGWRVRIPWFSSDLIAY